MAEIAQYFTEQSNDKVKCTLCPHSCVISSGERGICGVRENIEGRLYSINYGKASSISIDPIEKKPLYHFYPGNKILSLGTFGCNFACDFCQNWQISQKEPPLRNITPEEVVEIALGKDLDQIAYTYSEPMVWYEFVKETSKIASEHHISNVLVTNGYINPGPLAELLDYIDAANVDVKAYRDGFYQQFTGGSLSPVLKTVEKMSSEIHLEITTLIISDLNDDLNQLSELFSWLSGLNKGIPLHLSRYFPNYKMNRSATEIKKMKEVYELAQEYLDHVYLGNVNIKNTTDTYCPSCEDKLINRGLYSTKNKVDDGSCPYCGEEITGEFRKK